jgi:hypothetical protein
MYEQGSILAHNSYHGLLLLGSLGTLLKQSSQVGEQECRVRDPTYVHIVILPIAVIALNVPDNALAVGLLV